jgi:hypothetical protein
VVLMPHSSITDNFSSAVPLPPEMIAPAWPMRLPGGAVSAVMFMMFEVWFKVPLFKGEFNPLGFLGY